MPNENESQEFYANSVNVSTTLYDVSLHFRSESIVQASEDRAVKEITGQFTIRMSPQHAKSLVSILVKQIKNYESDQDVILPVPDNIAQMWHTYVKSEEEGDKEEDDL
jgi:hypothetical protein